MTDYTITSRDPRVRRAVCEFLTGNGIDPKVVPIHSTITVEGGRVTTDRYVRDENGKLLVGGQPVVETVAVDLLVPWPADLVLHPLCTVEDDGPCPNLAIGATQRCLQHVEPGAPLPLPKLAKHMPVPRALVEDAPADFDGLYRAVGEWVDRTDFHGLGAQLDEADFAAAHDSVQRDDAGALQAAAEAQLTGNVTTPPPPRGSAFTLDDLVEMKQTVDAAYGPPSIAGRVWQRLRRWAR